MFEIINETNKEIAEIPFLKDYLTFITEKEKLQNANFNIIFVTNNKIHEINKQYRHVDRVTDVISFALEDGDNSDITNIEDADFRILGDIYIAIDVAY